MNDRRHDRFRCHLAVDLHFAGACHEALTEDVAPDGLRLLTTTAIAPETHVAMVINAPDGGPPIRAYGRVAYACGPEVVDVPVGIGVQLIGVDGERRERWSALLEWLLAETLMAPESCQVFAPAERIARAPVLPRGYRADVHVAFQSLATLEALLRAGLTRGAVFLPVDAPLRVDVRTTAHFVHPETRETFAFPATVGSSGRSGRPGLRLDFRALPPGFVKAFTHFVTGRVADSPRSPSCTRTLAAEAIEALRQRSRPSSVTIRVAFPSTPQDRTGT